MQIQRHNLILSTIIITILLILIFIYLYNISASFVYYILIIFTFISEAIKIYFNSQAKQVKVKIFYLLSFLLIIINVCLICINSYENKKQQKMINRKIQEINFSKELFYSGNYLEYELIELREKLNYNRNTNLKIIIPEFEDDGSVLGRSSAHSTSIILQNKLLNYNEYNFPYNNFFIESFRLKNKIINENEAMITLDELNADLIIWGNIIQYNEKQFFIDLKINVQNNPDLFLFESINKLYSKIKLRKATLTEILGTKSSSLLNLLIGFYYYDKNNFIKATKYFNQIDESIHELSKLNPQYNFYIGYSYSMISNWDKALTFFKKGLKYSIESKDDKLIAVFLNSIGIILFKQNKFEDALKYFRRAEKIRKEINDKIGLSITYNNIGLLNIYQENYDSSKIYLNKSKKLLKKLNKKPEISVIENNLGIIIQKPKHLISEVSKKSFKNYHTRINFNKEHLVVIYNNIGVLSLVCNNLSFAQKYLNNAVTIMNDENQYLMGVIYNNIGILYYKKDEFKKSKSFLLKSQNIKTKNKQNLIVVLTNIGKIYHSENNINGSIKIQKEISTIAKNQNDYDSFLISQIELCKLYVEKNYYKTANSLLNFDEKKISNPALKDSLHNIQIEVLNKLGETSLNKKKYHEAINYFKRAYEISKKQGNLFKESEFALKISNSNKGINKYSQVLEWFKTHQKIRKITVDSTLFKSKCTSETDSLEKELAKWLKLYKTKRKQKKQLESKKREYGEIKSIIDAENDSSKLYEIPTRIDTTKKYYYDLGKILQNEYMNCDNRIKFCQDCIDRCDSFLKYGKFREAMYSLNFAMAVIKNILNESKDQNELKFALKLKPHIIEKKQMVLKLTKSN